MREVAVHGFQRRLSERFPRHPLPGRLLYDHVRFPEKDEELLVSRLAGKTWDELSPNETNLLFEDMSFCALGPEAFTYYLPAFILATLESEEGSHIATGVSITFTAGRITRLADLIERLDEQQYTVVSDFVSSMQQRLPRSFCFSIVSYKLAKEIISGRSGWPDTYQLLRR